MRMDLAVLLAVMWTSIAVMIWLDQGLSMVFALAMLNVSLNVLIVMGLWLDRRQHQ